MLNRLIVTTALATLACVAIGPPALAQTAGLAVEMPLGGYFRAGKWTPINCFLTNQGAPIDVQIRARLQDYGPNPPQRTYELDVALPSPANRRYTLYVLPVGAYVSRPLEVELRQGRQVIGKQQQSLRPLNDADRLVASITAQEGGLSGLAGNRTPGAAPKGAPPGYGGPGGMAPPGGGQGQIQVAYVKPELAPDRAIGYEIADLLVLGNLPPGALSQPQEVALLRWVQAGGRLIITGGVETSSLRPPTMRSLLPVEITGTVPLDSPGAFSGWTAGLATMFPTRQPSNRVRPPQARFVATACRRKPGATIVEARPGVPLLAAWSVGAGQVVFLAADTALPPLRGWEGLNDLWRGALFEPVPAARYLSLLSRMDDAGGMPGYNYRYSPYGGQTAALSNACLQVSQMDVPGFSFVGLFLLAYILVLVPGNYFYLKKRDRRELAWVTTPCIVFAFSGLAYLIGYGTKGGQVVMAQAGIVEAWAGRTSAPALSYLGLFSPRKTRYDVSTANDAIPLRPVDSDNNSRRSLRIAQGDGFSLKDVPIDMWDMGLFRGDHVVDLAKGFKSELTLVNGKLTGRVTNNTQYDLQDLSLLSGDGAVSLGALPPGGSLALNSRWSPIGSAAILSSNILQKLPNSGTMARMRRALAEPLTGVNPSYLNNTGGGGNVAWQPPDHPVLVGWVMKPLVPARVDGRAVRDQAAYLFLVHLPLR